MIIAAAQFAAVPLDAGANAARMAALLTEAAGRGAALVAFAELALTNYELAGIAADPGRYGFGADDPRLDPVREACRAAGAAAVVNCPGRTADGRLAITSYVYGPDGALLARYDKRHLYGAERDVFTPGTDEGGRFALDGLPFALATCYDNAFPDVARRAAADGCRVYVASSFHGAPERLGLYPAHARDNGLHVLLANGLGPGSPGPACGLSGAWAPDGTPVGRAPADAEGLVLAEVETS